MSDYKRAAATLEAEGIPLAKVDGTKEGELAKEFMIQGYPTLILFRDGMKQVKGRFTLFLPPSFVYLVVPRSHMKRRDGDVSP